MSTTTETKKPFTLYTGTTPNGYQVSVLLEELRAINPAVDYQWGYLDLHQRKLNLIVSSHSVHKINISTNVQKVHVTLYC